MHEQQQNQMQAQIRSMLRTHGLRMTEQRRLVLEAIQAAGYPICAPHILAYVQKQAPHVNKSTIYRTVEALQELGIISAADLGAGRTQYELYTDVQHHHLVCEKCGYILEIDDEPVHALRKYIAETYNFQLDLNHIALHGRCARCNASS